MFPSFLTAVFFAFSIVFAGRASKLVGATRAHYFRLLYALLCLAIYANVWGQGWQGKGFPLFLLSGMIGIALGDFCTFQSLRFISPRLAVLVVQCLCVPFAALIEWVWLGTALTTSQITGSGVILLGTTLSLLPGIHLPGVMRSILLGGALTTCGSLFQAIGAVITRRANEINLADSLILDGMSAAYQRICGAVILMSIIYGLIRMTSSKQPTQESKTSLQQWRRAIPWIVANGTAGMVLGVASFQWALMKTPAAIVLSIVALTPLVVIPIAWLLDRERPKLLSIIGSIIAVGGVLILTMTH